MIEIRSDSKLAIAGVGGADLADPELAALVQQIRIAARAFCEITWSWHPRAENGIADELVGRPRRRRMAATASHRPR